MRKGAMVAAVMVMLVLSSPAVSRAENIFSVEGAPTYEGRGFADTNFLHGSPYNDLDSELWTGTFWDGQYNWKTRTYLKFDLNAYSSPVQSALLYLYNGINDGNTAHPEASTFAPANVNIYQTGDFSSSTITWNSQPALGGMGGSAVVGEELGWYVWDVTSLVNSNLGSPLSLALVSTDGAGNEDGAGHVYYGTLTSCSSLKPYMDVTVVPEPVSSVLFTLGFGTLAAMGLKQLKDFSNV